MENILSEKEEMKQTVETTETEETEDAVDKDWSSHIIKVENFEEEETELEKEANPKPCIKDCTIHIKEDYLANMWPQNTKSQNDILEIKCHVHYVHSQHKGQHFLCEKQQDQTDTRSIKHVKVETEEDFEMVHDNSENTKSEEDLTSEDWSSRIIKVESFSERVTELYDEGQSSPYGEDSKIHIPNEFCDNIWSHNIGAHNYVLEMDSQSDIEHSQLLGQDIFSENLPKFERNITHIKEETEDFEIVYDDNENTAKEIESNNIDLCLTSKKHENSELRGHSFNELNESVKAMRCHVDTISNISLNNDRLVLGNEQYSKQLENELFPLMKCAKCGGKSDGTDNPYNCDLCSVCLTELAALNTHNIGYEEMKSYKSFAYTNGYMQNSSLIIPKRKNIEDKPCKCDDCGKGFSQNSKLIIHKRTHTGEKPYICDVCGKGFTQNSKLIFHKVTHTGEKPYKCDVCGKEFTQNSYLIIHIRTHTGEKPYKCYFCGKGFTQTSKLAVHKRTHTQQKPYICDVCGKGFAENSKLIIHKRTHTGEKPYKCDICGKGFTQNDNMIVHRRTHTGEKPYKCDFCGKGFSQNSKLVVHKRTHTQQKPYICDVCGKGFTESSKLIVHKRTHTGEKPYKCDICGKGFTQNGNMIVHKRTHTPDSSLIKT